MTNFGKKMLSFFAVFFLTLCIFGCNMSPEVGDREGLKEAKENVKWLLTNFNFGEVINDNVKDPVIGNVGIAEDADGKVSENDLRNGSYSEFMYGMSASFESSNPEVMDAQWVTYKKRAYVYGDPANPDKITGIETQETKALEFVVKRPEADQEDVNVDITIKVRAPYQIGEQTYYEEGSRTLTFTVLKKAESNTMTVGELEDYILANWDAFVGGSLFKDEKGNDLNVSIEGVVTEQVWGDGYDSHSFTMADDNGNGIYVYGPQSPVNIGDRVVVTGKPATYNGTIQISLNSTVEIISEASEYVAAEETTIEEWYAKYPTQGTDHKIPGHRVKVSGLFIQKTVDGYTNYAIQSTESDHFIQIYYKSYGAYEEQLLKEMLGKAAEFELAMYYCHNNGYWVGILNNYDYQPKLIEMTEEDKLAADVAGIKATQTVKNGEKVDLPTGTLANGTVLSGWTVDKEGYINLETLVADLGNAKEDVKVTLTATATNGEFSQEVKVEVTIKYVKPAVDQDDPAAPKEGVAYLLGVNQVSLGQTLYVTGNVANVRYLETTTDKAAAAKVYAEKAEGGYKFYILDGTTKKYLDTYFNAEDKVSLQFSAESNCVYAYNAETKAWATNLDGTDYYFGTYSTFNTLSASKTSYINAENTGVSQFPGFLESTVAPEAPEQPEDPANPQEGVEYLLGVEQVSLGQTLYVTGNVANVRYLETTTDKAAAAKVYAEKAEGGYKFYILDGTTKKYLDTYFNAENKVSLQFSAESNCVYAYNAETKAWATNLDGTDYYFGTYSTFNTLSASKTSYINAENTGVSQFPGFLEKAEAGQNPEPPVHEHKYVEGKCECGAVDPDYVAPEQPTNEIVFDFTTGSTGIGSGYNQSPAEITMNGITFGYLQMKSSGWDGSNFVMFNKSTGAHIYNKTAFAGSIVKIEVFIPSGASTSAQYFLSLHTEAAAGNITSTVSFKGAGKSFTIEATEAEGFKYFNLSSDSTTGKNGQLAKIVVTLAGGQTPEPPVHEHVFVEGKCECGELDPNYVAPEVNEIVKEGVAYLLGLNQVTLGKVLYVTGNVANVRYLEMTEDAQAAAKVYAEKAEGGYKFYILDGTTKKYLDTYFNAENKVSLQFSAESNCVYAYNAETKAWATNVNGTDYYFGTYSTFNTMSASKTSYITAENTGVSQFPGFFEEAKAGETPEPPVHEHVFVEGKCECGEVDPNYVAPEVSEIVKEGVAYLLGFNQVTLGKVLYATGNVSNVRYLEMTEDASAAAKVYAEKAEGGYKFYILDGTTKKYLDTYFNSENKVSLQFAAESTCVYAYNAETKAWATNVNGSDYYFGTYSNFNTMSASKTSYINAGNTGVSQFPGFFEEAKGGETPEPPVHEHVFVEGKCECGEVDPNYVAPGVPEVSTNKADLDTMGAKSSSYSDRTSKSGWTATYAALNCGGTTDMNPQFKVFGTENDFALTIAGGTDMVGKITSPVLSNGLSKLSFNYTKLFTDTTLSVTVYVKDVEGNVLYSEVITYAAEKNEKYVLKTYELVLDKPVEGDFVIEIVNNCPTGVTGKKDRISIWNITWENAPKHEHEFVEGKCECGEEDPNYVPPQAEPELFLTVGFESYASNTSAKASVAEGGVTFKTNSVNKMYTDNTPGSIALKFNNSSSSSAGFEATGFEKAIVKMTFKAATWNSAVTFTIVGTTADGQTITVKVDLANTAKAFAADEIVVEFEVPVVSFTFAASKRAFIDDISFYG